MLTPSLPLIVLCAFPACFLFFGREHAQWEMKLKSVYNSPVTACPITLEASQFWKWSLDANLDFFLPVAAAVGLGIVFYFVWLRPE